MNRSFFLVTWLVIVLCSCSRSGAPNATTNQQKRVPAFPWDHAAPAGDQSTPEEAARIEEQRVVPRFVLECGDRRFILQYGLTPIISNNEFMGYDTRPELHEFKKFEVSATKLEAKPGEVEKMNSIDAHLRLSITAYYERSFALGDNNAEWNQWYTNHGSSDAITDLYANLVKGIWRYENNFETSRGRTMIPIAKFKTLDELAAPLRGRNLDCALVSSFR